MAWPKEGPNHKPAKGYVHKPASGIPARGEALFGEASGIPAKAWTKDDHPTIEAAMAGKEVAAEIRARIAARKNEIVDRLISVATSVDSPESASNQAGIYLINQIAGTPAQSVDVTSAGGPLTVVIRRFDEGEPPA